MQTSTAKIEGATILAGKDPWLRIPDNGSVPVNRQLSLEKEDNTMEGTLWKWTNYFSGWQPRWFVLDSGILSYYKSQDDVNNGCKGSIKMSVCDVNVHVTDSTRLDLIIPGEAHFYVKAATPQERQQWLVALGSSKACQTNGRPTLSTVSEESSVSEDELKSKRSELRLYCDLLMQQVHSVKASVTNENKGNPDVEKLDEATSLLSATCDTFIKTLDECMKMAQAQPGSPGPDSVVPASPTRPMPKKGTAKGPLQRSSSVDRFVPSRGSTARHSHSFDETVGRTRILGGSRTASESSDDHSGRRAAESHDESDTLDERDEARTVHTFFSTMPKTFHDIRLHSDDSIPVSTFLDACRAILPIFDKLNPTAFAPVKMDVAGNIRKIQQKYSSNPKQFRTLQSMVLHEVQANQHRDSNSATESLLWLKRALEFILQFLLECLSGEQDMGVAASNAYSKTLQPFHSWVVRGVFALAAKALPYRTEFMNAMGATENDKDDPHFEQILEADLRHYTKHLTATLKIINAFYEEHQLNNEEQI